VFEFSVAWYFADLIAVPPPGTFHAGEGRHA
jgi:hypothetical protein